MMNNNSQFILSRVYTSTYIHVGTTLSVEECMGVNCHCLLYTLQPHRWDIYISLCMRWCGWSETSLNHHHPHHLYHSVTVMPELAQVYYLHHSHTVYVFPQSSPHIGLKIVIP